MIMVSKKIASLILAIAITAFASHAQQTLPTIEVSGTASISVVPDRITVEIGLEEYFKALAADSSKVSLRSIEADVRKALGTAGVGDSQITVTDVGNYSNRAISAKFLMAKRLSAVLTDYSQLDFVSENLPELGITSFSITKLDNSDMTRYNKEGLKAALDAARAKAEFIAANEGLTDLKVWNVEETSPGYNAPQAFSNVGYEGGFGMNNMRRIERKYSVRVTFVFKQTSK